ncbi:hypothetical protein [Bifidobacterium pullorum]|uniref:hypothetical protein n=1 Tax=Bifidobacterium pullorum TaxID=78448 RepID=UPI003207D5AB
MHAALGLTLREHEAAKRIAGVEVSSIDFDDDAGMGDQYCGLHFTVSRGDVTLHMNNDLSTEDPDSPVISGHITRVKGEDVIWTGWDLDAGQAQGIVDAIACHPNVFRADLYAQAFKAIAQEPELDGESYY